MSTIEPTREMVQEIYSRIDFVNHGDDGIAEGLAAIFEAIERDYQLTKLCAEELVPGLRCTRTVFDEPHRGDHEGKTSTGSTVKWS